MTFSRCTPSILFAATWLIACSSSDSGALPENTASEPTGDVQTAFRVRSDFTSGLNHEGGWAAPVNQPATVLADQPFRIRFEVEAGEDTGPRRFALQYRRNGDEWQPLLAEDFPYPLKQIERSPGSPDRRPNIDWVFETHSATLRRLPDPSLPALRFEAGQDPVVAWAAEEIEWTPNEFSLDLRLDKREAGRVGLVFEDRGQGSNSLVELIPPDRARVLAVDGEEERVIVETTIDVPLGEWFELKVAVDDSEWSAELQDRALFVWTRTGTSAGVPRLGLRLAADSRVDLRRLMIEGEASTPRVSIVSSPVYEHGAGTEDRLLQSGLPFAGGTGMSLASRTPAWDAGRAQGEWSVPIVIRRFADAAAMNENGDRFDFRLVDGDDRPVPAALPASVTVAVADAHLGGTFVETPMRLGPWQNDAGELYFIMEPSETWNRPIMVKSSDNGRSWREVDAAGRPETGDLEGLATVYGDGRIHILHQISDEVLYHSFDTSEGVDAWLVRDERIAAPPAPPTQVADLALRSDGSIVAVYGAGKGLSYSIRSPEGDWGVEHPLPGPADAVLSGPTLVLGRNDVVHLANTASDGTAWVRRIHPEHGASDPVLVADALGTDESDAGALLPLVTLDEGGTLVLIYRVRDGRLYERRSAGNDAWSSPVAVTERAVVQSAIDSDQVGADVVADGEALHVLFIDAESGALFHTIGRDGRWSSPEIVAADAPVQWVRGQVIRTGDGNRSYGFVYDAGSNGGSGRNRFGSIPLPGDTAIPVRGDQGTPGAAHESGPPFRPSGGQTIGTAITLSPHSP